MKHKVLLFILLTSAIIGKKIMAQTNIETLRKQGFEAKTAKHYPESIYFYKQIVAINPNDYDAILALSKIYYLNLEYQNSVIYFNKILSNDETDTEALIGLGNNYLNLNKLNKSIEYYKKAIHYSPNNVSIYFKLAKAYSWQGKTDKAIETYQKVINIDDTYSEAWKGIGKMHSWNEKPYLALDFYKKAIKLDPSNIKTKKEYEQINRQIKYKLSATYKVFNETENTYQIDAINKLYGIQKRISNRFNVSVNYLVDNSDRDFVNTTVGDTIRKFNNVWLKIGYISAHHKIYTFAGYSSIEKKMTSYGLSWKWTFKSNSFKFTNTITGGYDYFFYWNQIGKNAISDNLSILHKKFGLTLGISHGSIDAAPMSDIVNNKNFVGKNPHTGYNISLKYKVLSNPKITLATNYSYLNYQYKSALYYSPFGRKLFGPSTNIYYPFNRFYIYSDFAYNFGSEFYYEKPNEDTITKEFLNANNWSTNAEFGYTHKSFSTSLNASRFFNKYYSNYLASINFKYRF